MASSSSAKSREHSKSTLESIKIHHPETYNKYQRNSHDYDDSHHMADDDDASSVECETSKNSNNLLDVMFKHFISLYTFFIYIVIILLDRRDVVYLTRHIYQFLIDLVTET